MPEPHLLEGQLFTWTLGPNPRRFLSATLPFRTARVVFGPRTGSGEMPRDVRDLKRAMLAGEFAPTPVSVGLCDHHRASVESWGAWAVIPVAADDPLPLTHGRQSFAALGAIAEEAEAAGDLSLLTRVLEAPIPATVHLDGEPTGRG